MSLDTLILAAILTLPLLGAAAGVGLESRLGRRAAVVSTGAMALVAVLSVIVLSRVIVEGPFRFTLSRPGPDGWPPGLLLDVDRLGAVLMLLISGISTIVHLYSMRYLQDERGYGRFYALLGLTTLVLFLLVTSANLFMLFVFWQLVSWLLYLLLAFDYERAPAYQSALKTFLVHRVGDLMFLAGVLLTFHVYGTLDLVDLFSKVTAEPVTLSLWPAAWLEVQATTAITALIFVGAMAKSAQFPLHVWLPDTMDTPTPVSALMHAGIVNAGGFLLSRLAPLYGTSPTVLHVVFLIGGLTTLLGASMMLTQNDIKKTLGFSTMGQMGYMIMECGLGAFALAIFHLIAHGLFKATLFLSAGGLIGSARHEPKHPERTHPLPDREFSPVTWGTGFAMTLVLPLVIVLLAHDVVEVPLLEFHGSVIFLFFGWVTASQAIFSLYRLDAVASWKVAGTMVGTLLVIMTTYLWAGEAFTRFLYPAPGEAAGYFQAAALPVWLFDGLVITTAALIVLTWVFLYARASGTHALHPQSVAEARQWLYVHFLNRLYVDQLYACVGERILRMARQLDRPL